MILLSYYCFGSAFMTPTWLLKYGCISLKNPWRTCLTVVIAPSCVPSVCIFRSRVFCLMARFLKNYHAFIVFLVFDRYFRKNNLYGLACFENMPVDSQSERGARMKSVGILATSYTLLYRHMQFLETQVRWVLFSQHFRMLILLLWVWHGSNIFQPEFIW